MAQKVIEKSIATEQVDRLGTTAVTSFGWNISGSIVRYGSGFVINIILARILGPEPYGLIALAMIIISISTIVIDSGLNAGLIQKKELTDKNIRFVLTIQVILGISFTLGLVLIAPVIAEIFQQPKVIPILRVLSTVLLLQAASQTATGILKRKLKFKKIQQAQIISYLIGYLGLGLPLAYGGYGVWSLVVAQIIQSLAYLIIAYCFTLHPVRFYLKDGRQLINFGGVILMTNIVNWIIFNIDNTLVGRYYGTVNLGFYSRALTLVMTPAGLLVSSVQSVVFSATSRIQESIPMAKKVFLNVFRLVSLVVPPLMMIVVQLSNEIIKMTYGEKWTEAATFLVPLSFAVIFYSLMAIQGPILAGIGKPELELKIEIITALVGGVGLFLIAKTSMVGLVWAVFGMYLLRFVLILFTSMKALDISYREITRYIVYSILISSVVYIGVAATKQFIQGINNILGTSITAFIGIIIWLIILFLSRRLLFPQEIVNFVQNKLSLARH